MATTTKPAKTARISVWVTPEFRYTVDVFATTNRTTMSELLIEGLLAKNPELREVYDATDKPEK